MKKLKEVSRLVKRLVLFFIGMSIIQFGVAVFLQTSIGSDPFTVFTQGLATVLNKTGLKEFSIVQMISGSTEVTPGVANMIILIALFIIILLTDMKRIKIGTLICVVGVGPIIDLGVRVEIPDLVMKDINENFYEAKMIYHTTKYRDKMRK